MPLPQQVIDRLSEEPPKTPGWSSGILIFSVGIFLLSLAAYFGLSTFYVGHLNSQLSAASDGINTVSQAISSGDQANLITFYSEITHLNSLLDNHIFTSHFFAWLEANTDANISYGNFSLSIDATGYHVTLTATAQNEADVVEQLAVFQSSPQVKKMSASSLSVAGATGEWASIMTLTMDPAVFGNSFTTSTAQ